jgi:hypothetical protein
MLHGLGGLERGPHLLSVGFRSRIVTLDWLWAYVTFRPGLGSFSPGPAARAMSVQGVNR